MFIIKNNTNSTGSEPSMPPMLPSVPPTTMTTAELGKNLSNSNKNSSPTPMQDRQVISIKDFFNSFSLIHLRNDSFKSYTSYI